MKYEAMRKTNSDGICGAALMFLLCFLRIIVLLRLNLTKSFLHIVIKSFLIKMFKTLFVLAFWAKTV